MTPDEIAAQVDAAFSVVGYGWPGGVVLTELDDPRAQRVMELNSEYGAVVPQLGAWVSWCTPLAGLQLPADVPIEPCFAKPTGRWATFHAHATAQGMMVVACDANGIVLYVLATESSREYAPLLALAALRTIEDTDMLPSALEDAVTHPPSTWVNGWTIERDKLVTT